MATDQQLRARFLEESAEYFEQMEQALLSLPDAEKPAQQIDVAMRAAHSLKGGAGMMGFHPMAQIAHRLEDFLKIIRARRVEVDTDLETLLLQGLDSLKDVRLQLSSGFTVDDDWIALYVDPIVAQLKGRLGELSEDDENRLLSETEDVDVAVLVFNVGVEEALDAFETSRDRYEGESLREALCEQAMRLSELGLMGGIDAFVSLCQSVYEQAQVLSLEQIPVFCDQALTAWKRSQSLVQLGRTGKLPTQLSFIPKITTVEQTNANAFSVAEWDATPSPATSTPVADIEIEPPSLTEGFDLSLDTEGFDLSLDSEALESLQTEIAAAVNTESPSLTEGFDLSLNSEALESWQTEMAVATAEALASQPDSMAGTPVAKVFRPMAKNPLEMETLVSGATVTEQKTERLAVDSPGLDSPELDSPELDSPELDLSGLDLSELDSNDLSQLQTAFDQIEIAATPDTSEPEKGIEQLDKAVLVDEVTPPEPSEAALWSNRPETKQQTVLPQRGVSPGRTGTLRIAAEELQHINSLFGTLILERNAINLRQEQLDSFAALLHERMQALEAFNVRLRQWYDRASMESLLPTGTTPAGMPVAIAKSRSSQDASISSLSQDFDALEMDQYSELHLMAQEQMETVVKLQEVTADIRLGLHEMGQATQSLNSTTRQLQNRITRTQMRPFSYVVGRFPRLIRDLSVQYGKKVQLKVEGETTLFERLALDLLADPLTHILRNSFDHGIESNDERVKAGKPAIGLITMRASQLGNRARITVRDDGRGINLDKIRDRMRQHRIDEAVITKLSKQDLLSVIFDAGFSTADKVTELSGRGVGMDVVRTNLQQLGGDIQVDTQLGQGTVFTIDIPLSLSVLRIMLLEQQSLVFAVPVNAIEELTACDPQQIIPSEDGPKLAWQGQQIPWITLENHLTFNGSAALTSLEGKPT
ncbi:MAG: Hpt domain-containing protein, partial [Cyanobacteria bacterium P01_F01_bin.86]